MNPSIFISAVVALLSLHYAEAFFGADIVTGSGALFTGGGGAHVILGAGAGIGGFAAVIGAGILLKSLVLLGASRANRGKRSINEDNDSIFTLLAASEPSSCIRQLICDVATGEHPSEYDVILSLFNEDTLKESPKYDFAVAASVGNESKSLEACELRYTCPLSSAQIFNALN
jgi:hypothetical protein